MEDIQQMLTIGLATRYFGMEGKEAFMRDLEGIEKKAKELKTASRASSAEGAAAAHDEAAAHGEVHEQLSKKGRAYHTVTNTAIYAGAAAAGILYEAGKAAVGVADVQAKVASQFNIAQDRMARYRDFVSNTSAELLQKQTDMLQAVGQASTAGFGPQITEKITEGSAKIAAIFNSALGPTTQKITGFLKALNVPAAQVESTMNMMAAAGQKSGQGMSLFTSATNKALLAAKGAHVPMSQMLGLIAQMSKGFGPRAGVQISSVITRLMNPTDAMVTAAGGRRNFDRMVNFQRFGIQGVLQNIMGQADVLQSGGHLSRAAGMRNALLGGASTMNIVQQAARIRGVGLGNTEGTIDTGFSKVSKTTAARFKEMQLSLEDMEVTIGTAVIPTLNKLVHAMLPIIQAVSHWIEEHPKLTAEILKWAIAVGVIAAAMRIIIPLISLFNAVMAANPITLIIIALVALGIGLYELYTHWKPFRILVNAAWVEIQKFGTWLMKTMIPIIQAVGHWLVTVIPPAFHKVMDVVQNVLNWVSAHWPAFQGFIMHPVDTVRAALGRFRDWLGTMFANLLQHVLNLVGGFGQSLLRSFVSLVNTVINWIKQHWPQLLIAAIAGPFGLIYIFFGKQIAKWVGFAGRWVGGLARGILSNVSVVTTALTKVLTSAFTAAIDAVKKLPGVAWLGNLIGKIGSIFHGGASSMAVAGARYPGGTFGGPLFGMPFAAVSPGPPNASGLPGGFHADISEAAGTLVRLPPGSWKLIASFGTPGVGAGREEYWQHGNAIFDIMHMSSIAPIRVGTTLPGGTPIALSGGRRFIDAAPSNTSGPHLHVGYNAAALAYELLLTGGAGFYPAPRSGAYPGRGGAPGGMGIPEVARLSRYLSRGELAHIGEFRAAQFKTGVPVKLLEAVAWLESHAGLNPNARLLGVMNQPSRDWHKQVLGAAQTIAILFKQFHGDWRRILATYSGNSPGYQGILLQILGGLGGGSLPTSLPLGVRPHHRHHPHHPHHHQGPHHHGITPITRAAGNVSTLHLIGACGIHIHQQHRAPGTVVHSQQGMFHGVPYYLPGHEGQGLVHPHHGRHSQRGMFHGVPYYLPGHEGQGLVHAHHGTHPRHTRHPYPGIGDAPTHPHRPHRRGRGSTSTPEEETADNTGLIVGHAMRLPDIYNEIVGLRQDINRHLINNPRNTSVTASRITEDPRHHGRKQPTGPKH